MVQRYNGVNNKSPLEGILRMKNIIRDLNIDDYDYDLPEERIAQYPFRERDGSKLLIYNKGIISEDVFRNIHWYLPSDSLMVFNNTRVIRARIIFRKETGADIEVFCLEPLVPGDYEQSFASGSPVEWKCIIGNLKKWKKDIITSGFLCKGTYYTLSAGKIKAEGEAWRILFRWDPADISFGEVIEATGHIPLPPYVKREDEDEDYIRYQTVYSRIKGSVAAPTAGLHFTESVLEEIRNKGISRADLTLHVGAGTFRPVKTKDISHHEMHCEHFFLKKEVVESLLSRQGKIIAVGTTSVRALESLYWLGVQTICKPETGDNELDIEQWVSYNHVKEHSLQESLTSILNLMRIRKTEFLRASTKIMIIPGYKFRVVSGMITNFHQPKSTLLLLVSAWAGNNWKKIYQNALENGFRFLSYGDTSLLLE